MTTPRYAIYDRREKVCIGPLVLVREVSGVKIFGNDSQTRKIAVRPQDERFDIILLVSLSDSPLDPGPPFPPKEQL